MNAAVESLVRDLHQRGIVVAPRGDQLVINPVEKLGPGEIESIRVHERRILRLFGSGRFRLVECPGDECAELLFVVDGLAYCKAHGMSVRFSSQVVERDFSVRSAAPIARRAVAA